MSSYLDKTGLERVWNKATDKFATIVTTDKLGGRILNLETNSATKQEVSDEVAKLVDSAPETLDTLNELAAALGDDPNFATTISAQIGGKVNTSTYNDGIAALNNRIDSITPANIGAAPTSHASAATTYGVGSTTNYGHLKVGSNISVSSGTISLSKENITTALGYTPPTTDTDTKVTQGRSTAASYRPLLMHNLYGDYGTDVGQVTDLVYYNETIAAKASTGELKATSFVGSGASLTSLNASNISSGTVPITHGGTGATDAATARSNLGITPANIGAIPNDDNPVIYLHDAVGGEYWGFERKITAVSDTIGATGLRFTAEAAFRLCRPTDGSYRAYKIFDESQTVPVANGGTGSTTRTGAWNNIVAAGGTFTGTPIASNSTYYGAYWFKPSMASSAMGKIFHWGATSSSSTVLNQSYFTFRQYSYTANSTTTSDKYEDFSLPITAAGLGANRSYSILTSKNAVTIAQGGTGATTAAQARTNLGVLALDGSNIMTGHLNIRPTGNSSEGGQINLHAAQNATTKAGTSIDNVDSQLRIFGIASADGTTKTGTGTTLVIDPYAKTITGGYTITGTLNGNATNVTGTVSVSHGGTGSTSKSGARVNLGISSGTSLPSSGSTGDIFILYSA